MHSLLQSLSVGVVLLVFWQLQPNDPYYSDGIKYKWLVTRYYERNRFGIVRKRKSGVCVCVWHLICQITLVWQLSAFLTHLIIYHPWRTCTLHIWTKIKPMDNNNKKKEVCVIQENVGLPEHHFSFFKCILFSIFFFVSFFSKRKWKLFW